MQFQKISIPTPWKVNGNSKGVGGLQRKYGAELEFPKGWEGSNLKTFHGRGMDIFWKNTIQYKIYVATYLFETI